MAESVKYLNQAAVSEFENRVAEIRKHIENDVDVVGRMKRDELLSMAEVLCADWRRLLRKVNDAVELIDELRPYARDWDWKYGQEWDQMERHIKAVPGEVEEVR